MAKRRRGRRRLLVIPDVHAIPGYDNSRMDYLGRFIADVKPCYVACLGDLWDYKSLSRHDPFGSRAKENARYHEDTAAGAMALERLHHYAKGATPEYHFIEGNHDARPGLWLAENPVFEKELTLPQTIAEGFGWRWTPFRERVCIEGVWLSHHMPSGSMGKPIGGKHMASSMIDKQQISCVVGHAHTKDSKEFTQGNGNKIFAISAGCYTHPDYGRDGKPVGSWCKDTRAMWWLGVLLLDDLDGEGYYDRLTWITQRWLRRNYGRAA